jgi:preprotein translocase subunit Sss1
MHKIRASMPPKHVKPTQLRHHGRHLGETGGFLGAPRLSNRPKRRGQGLHQAKPLHFAPPSTPAEVEKGGVKRGPHPTAEFPPPPIETWAASARPNNQEFQMDIITLIKIIGGFLIVGGIGLAIHETNQMMDAMTPAAQGVALTPISR